MRTFKKKRKNPTTGKMELYDPIITEQKEKANPLDLNGDGVFDHKDVSIGAKAMAKGRKIKKTIAEDK